MSAAASTCVMRVLRGCTGRSLTALGECRYEYDTDYVGTEGVISTNSARSLQECCNMCYADSQCRAFCTSCHSICQGALLQHVLHHFCLLCTVHASLKPPAARSVNALLIAFLAPLQASSVTGLMTIPRIGVLCLESNGEGYGVFPEPWTSFRVWLCSLLSWLRCVDQGPVYAELQPHISDASCPAQLTPGKLSVWRLRESDARCPAQDTHAPCKLTG